MIEDTYLPGGLKKLRRVLVTNYKSTITFQEETDLQVVDSWDLLSVTAS